MLAQDDADAVDRNGDNDDTFKITDKVTQESLCQGEVFLMVHGQTSDAACPDLSRHHFSQPITGKNSVRRN